MINYGKKNLLGVLVNAVDYEYVTSRIISAAQKKESLTVSALAVHGIMTGVQNPVQRYRLNHFDLIVPDGQPVRWGVDWLWNIHLPDRVYGPMLIIKVCGEAARLNLPIYLYGSKKYVLENLSANLAKKFPDLKIAGMAPSLFRKADLKEKGEIIRNIKDSGAVITFVGLGCPRQETWAYEFAPELGHPVIAVGAAFDFHSGLLRQAPNWMQKSGLEWLFRFINEPSRLWKRYIILNPWYLTLLVLQKTGLRKFKPDAAISPEKEELFA